MTDLSNAIAARTGGFLNYRLWVAEFSLTGSPDALTPFLEAHMAYVLDLEARGRLFAAGPILDDQDKVTGAGLFFLRADSLAEAEEMARADPMVVNGVRRVSVRQWRMNVGGLDLRLRWSEGRVHVV